ncbi:uncharacterized protein BDZ99DRAFT_571590 [Mytilinidion resinicola]|uniref:Bromo domain-containing protein n=1 Tax=Mytilinidion resinicola TaxID=574789 RepID=A0A6A6YIR3_9PEZI|nr:uncharacterized protein BDZ99DRAFT_571590 [Mytilinidion resinicola]KAF2808691.1 hypothetical protein BDZ99DRAFT_571590 [Mytilinidion resinicola]
MVVIGRPAVLSPSCRPAVSRSPAAGRKKPTLPPDREAPSAIPALSQARNPSRRHAAAVLAPLPRPHPRPRPPKAQRARGMSTIDTPYSPLETLLLFQSLAAYGVEPAVFSRISDLLKKNPHITSSDRFEVGRLSPDSLRNWYLKELKREAQSEKHDGANGDSEGHNGEVQNPRKRKAPSPSFPTVQEASQHTHLIPRLVAKLYSGYRAHVTELIRDDERRYDRLQRDLEEIEQGKWDDRLQQDTNGTGKKPARQSQTPTKHASQRATPDDTATAGSLVPPTTAQKPSSAEQTTPKPVETRNGQPTLQPESKPEPDPSPRKTTALLDSQAPPATPHLTQPQPPNTPGHARIPSQPQGPPKPPLTQYPAAGYTTSPTAVHRSPYPPQPHSGQFPISSASPNAPSAAPAGHPPSPAGVPAYSTQYPQLPPSPYSANGVPQYPGPSPDHLQYPPTAQRYPGPYTPGQPSPGPVPSSQTPQQQRSYYAPYATHQTPYPPTQQAHQAPPIMQYMLPPFQVTPQDPTRAYQQQQKTAQQVQVSTPNNRQPLVATQTTSGTSQPSAQPQFPPRVLPGHLQGPFSTPSGVRGPRPSLTLATPSSVTRWKHSAQKPPRSPVRAPSPEPLSDAENDVKEPAQKASSSKSASKRKTKSKDTLRTEDISGDVGVRQMRSGRIQPTRPRGGSVTPSVVGSSIRGRTRSQSVTSHTETMSADHESAMGYKVKTEPGTSADMIDDDRSATNTPVVATRRRGGTLQSLQSNKRKRNVRETSVADSEEMPSTPGLQTVVAPRHFSRMCNPIMNDILSHKHASIFSNPVKEKDAEGYYDIIKRPQDLKSIRTAIAAGAKAVQAAASSDTPAGSPGGGGGNVILPLSPEVVPPKAIVNSAQLEKEFMRMFANAVMFNTGEDGVVQDAKEMYEAVEKSVTTWRSSAERTTGRMESEDIGAEDDAPTTVKRRKM